jgi:hypothetical protein
VADHPTQVLSLDELMDLAAEPRDDTATMPIRTTPAAKSTPTPTPPAPLDLTQPPQRMQPEPAARPQHQDRPERPPRPQPRIAADPDLRERVMADARRAYDAALAHAKEWLKAGDNGLITATLVVTLLLLLVVAAV